MELPAIKLPQIELPFDIPVLLHPPIDHFIIALPIIVLLLEIANLIVKKRAIGVASFFLLVLTVAAAVAAYVTGSVDGKEAFPLLSEAAQGELKSHKLLGTYLIFFSVVVLVFKILSALISRGLMKALYLLVLILFVAGILKQGKEGGELVYEYGVNVEKVQELDSELDDLKEELEELEEASKSVKKEEEKPAEKTEPKEAPSETESVKTEVKETSDDAASTMKKKAEEVKIEVIPQEAEKPQIATH
jgi:uncharacterized membrane protein